MTLPTNTLPTGSGMPVDPEDVRWLALDAECDRIREALRVYGGHTASCPGRPCSCGFEMEWRRVFGGGG